MMQKQWVVREGWAREAGIFLLAVALTGCGKEPPATFPVQGKLVFERGGDVARLHNSQAGILFESVDPPGVQSYGEIAEDGSFKLMSSFEGVAKEGAIAGSHRGRLILDEEVEKLVPSKFLDMERSGISLTVPAQAEVVIKISR